MSSLTPTKAAGVAPNGALGGAPNTPPTTVPTRAPDAPVKRGKLVLLVKTSETDVARRLF